MAERALIIVVDNESDALAAMLDALTRRFDADYRVVPYLSQLPFSGAAAVTDLGRSQASVLFAPPPVLGRCVPFAPAMLLRSR